MASLWSVRADRLEDTVDTSLRGLALVAPKVDVNVLESEKGKI